MTQAFQTGIIPEASSDALFVTFNLVRDHVAQAKQALAASTDIIHTITQQFPDAELCASIGLNHTVWPLFDNTKKPLGLMPFPHFTNQDIDVNETAGELVFHIRSMRRDTSYQLANALYQAFGQSLELVEEVSCFKYLDNRDLTGFVDGTENPEGEKRKQVALVGEEDADFAGGSYLNLMRFVHDLEKWEHQDLKSQEDIYGRTKYTNEEYTAAQKSPHAHTKRTSLKDSNGQSLEILRHSMPFATLKEKGLMFASYSKTPSIFNRMLESMVKGDEQGRYDHLMKFTTAHTGNAFFIPPTYWLTSLLD